MFKILDTVINRLNLTKRMNFSVVLLACVAVTCILSDIITVLSFNARIPEVMLEHTYDIRLLTFTTTLSIATLFFFAVLSLIKHIDQLRQALDKKVRHDNLTGVLARETFLQEVEANTLENEQNALLLIDADFFKRINDTHGHAVGDKALVIITDVLQKGIRSSDRLGRVGGEEFAIYLHNTDRKTAIMVAERLVKSVKEASSRLSKYDIDLSISIGAVVYKDNIILPKLLKKADELLYRAKANGRNRVEHEYLCAAV